MNLDLMAFFSRNNLARIKDGVYVTNFDDKNSIGTHWVWLFIDRNATVGFDSFGNEYISQEIFKKSKINQLLTIYLEYKIMNLLYVCFIVSLPHNVSETLLYYINLFSPNNYKKNEQIIYKYFKVKK